MEQHFNDRSLLFRECQDLGLWIQTQQSKITEILQNIETRETIYDEIHKSIETLFNIEQEKINNVLTIGNGSVFLPINLPFYSLIIFGIIPGLFAKQMFIRPPQIIGEVIKKLFSMLPKTNLTDKIIICCCERNEFIERYVKKSKFIIFTGTLNNANSLRKKIRNDQLFIFNGQGVNPIVVSENANIDLAVEKTIAVRRFNSGQDCAAADCVLIHKSIYENFKQKLIQCLNNLNIGTYREKIDIGPLYDPKQILIATDHLSKWKQSICYGGYIDIRNAIVYPSVIETFDICQANIKELFSPIWHLCQYENDDQLKQYFEHPSYREYAMYVSLFGNSAYIEQQSHTIVLREQIIIDIEKGNKEYGGYSIGSSFVQHKGQTSCRPILISRELQKAFGEAL